MKKNEKGFGAIEGLLIAVMVGLVGFVGWFVLRNNDTTKVSKSGDTASSTKESTDVFTSQNKTFSVDRRKLPAGWTVTALSGSAEEDGIGLSGSQSGCNSVSMRKIKDSLSSSANPATLINSVEQPDKTTGNFTRLAKSTAQVTTNSGEQSVETYPYSSGEGASYVEFTSAYIVRDGYYIAISTQCSFSVTGTAVPADKARQERDAVIMLAVINLGKN